MCWTVCVCVCDIGCQHTKPSTIIARSISIIEMWFNFLSFSFFVIIAASNEIRLNNLCVFLSFSLFYLCRIWTFASWKCLWITFQKTSLIAKLSFYDWSTCVCMYVYLSFDMKNKQHLNETFTVFFSLISKLVIEIHSQ